MRVRNPITGSDAVTVLVAPTYLLTASFAVPGVPWAQRNLGHAAKLRSLHQRFFLLLRVLF